MKFDIAEETKFLKLKFFGMLAVSFVVLFFIITGFRGMEEQYKQGEPLTSIPNDEMAEKNQVLRANDLLYERFVEFKKISSQNVPSDQLLQAAEVFTKTIDSLEISSSKVINDESRKSLLHTIATYRLLLKQPSSENVANNNASAENNDEQIQQMQSQIQAKDARIAELESQLSTAGNNGNDNKIYEDYKKLQNKNKSLDFDLRSLLKQNLDLTRENNALIKANQDLTNQLKKNGQ